MIAALVLFAGVQHDLPAAELRIPLSDDAEARIARLETAIAAEDSFAAATVLSEMFAAEPGIARPQAGLFLSERLLARKLMLQAPQELREEAARLLGEEAWQALGIPAEPETPTADAQTPGRNRFTPLAEGDWRPAWSRPWTPEVEQWLPRSGTQLRVIRGTDGVVIGTPRSVHVFQRSDGRSMFGSQGEPAFPIGTPSGLVRPVLNLHGQWQASLEPLTESVLLRRGVPYRWYAPPEPVPDSAELIALDRSSQMKLSWTLPSAQLGEGWHLSGDPLAVGAHVIVPVRQTRLPPAVGMLVIEAGADYDASVVAGIGVTQSLAEAEHLIGGDAPASDGHLMAIASSANGVAVFRVSDGSLVWAVDASVKERANPTASALPGDVLLSDGFLYWSHGHQLARHQASSGDESWTTNTESAIELVAVADERVIGVQREREQVVAFDVSSGEMQWRSVPLPGATASAAWVAGNRLLLAGTSAEVQVLDVATGTRLESLEAHPGAGQEPTPSSRATLVLLENGRVAAWRFLTE